MKLAKLEVALRHTETAIDLFANEKDPVAIYSLAMTAFNVLRDLAEHDGGSRILAEATAWVRPEMKDKFWPAFRGLWSFMKHADRDPSEVWERFEPEANDGLLMICAMLLGERGHDHNDVLRTYMAWFTLMHPEFLKEARPDEAKSSLRQATERARELKLHEERSVSLEALRQQLRQFRSRDD